VFDEAFALVGSMPNSWGNVILESERMHLEISTVIAFHKVKPWGIPNSWGN